MSKTKDYKSQLETRRMLLTGKIAAYEQIDKTSTLDSRERQDFEDAKYEIREVEARMANAGSGSDYGPPMGTDGRPLTRDSRKRGKNDNRVEGRAGEVLGKGMTMRAWHDRAVENNLAITTGDAKTGYHPVQLRNQGTDRNYNRLFGEMCGFCPATVESRSLLEDTTGSAKSLIPTQWVADFIDVLLPNLIMGQAGYQTVPMAQEFQSIPVFTSTVSFQYVSEGSPITLDANPAFSNILLQSQGAWMDQTLISVQAANDAFIDGNLPSMIANAMARKLKISLDTAAIAGAGFVGCPGLVGETGFVFRKQTGDAGTTGFTPTDTQEEAVIAENILKLNTTPNAFISNIGVHQSVRRIPLSTYGWYFQDPPLIGELGIKWITSENAALGYTENDPATAANVTATGGSYSSLYCGPFDRFAFNGVRLDMSTTILKERYADLGMIGVWGVYRGSIRYAHPETFSRTIGFITK
jgi:HK97 family phage major capsid protein